MPIRQRHPTLHLTRRPGPAVLGVLLGALTGVLVIAGVPATAVPTSAPTPDPPDDGRSAPAPARSGIWPLQPRPPVVAGFDPPATPFGRGHRGVDLLGRVGQAVHTALPGRVRFAAVLAGRGVVVVDHGDVRTTYEPVTASVHVGDVLAEGAVIGTLVAHGSHCFPRACLHWGLLRGPAYLDPLTLVGAGPVRLLPFDGALLRLGSGVDPARGWPAAWAEDSSAVAAPVLPAIPAGGRPPAHAV